MANTVRELILQEFVTRITPLGINPVGRAEPSLEESDEPLYTVHDGVEERHENQSYGTTRVNLIVTVELGMSSLTPSPSINEQLGDVIKAVIGTDSTFAGLANNITYAGSSPTYRVDGSVYSGIQCLFNVDYSYPIGDPFQTV